MDILRLHESRWNELFVTTIYGLRLKRVNEGTDSLEDPMITFLREVLTAIPCAAHMSLDPWHADQAKVFQKLYPAERFLPTPVGSYCRVQLFTGEGRAFGAFFPTYQPGDLLVPDRDGDPLVEMLLIFDQPNLYLGVDDERRARLEKLFTHPPTPEDPAAFSQQWLRAATEIVPLVLAGGHDEGCFHAYARSPEPMALLREPLARTEAAIRVSTWFEQHAPLLRWSEEKYEWCLVLPCGTVERRRCE
jgi:hypothetical protein